MNLKRALKSNSLTNSILAFYKDRKRMRAIEKGLDYHGVFINRSKGQKYFCMMLAGYKEYLYQDVLDRLKRVLRDDIDVCIITSGKYSDSMSVICQRNSWSYLSTKENNVALVQNVAINLHPEAEYIFKLDEDIFLTERYFDKMIDAYLHAESREYTPGVLAPTIPVNGYGYIKVLEEYNLLEYYTERFGTPKITADAKAQIICNPEVAVFFWGEGGVIPSIDEMNRRFGSHPLKESPCPIRFSIGAILFKRDLWEEMGHFPVDRSNNAMGVDETELCAYCCIHSKPLLVSDNTVVGHLGYGPQNSTIKEFYINHPENFRMIE